MPRTEEANQQIREDRCRQILEASLKIFARKGLTDTRITDIAVATGMSQGLIYRYFTSKEEVFANLVEGTLQLTLMLAEHAEFLPGPAIEKLGWLTGQLLPYQYEQPEGVLILIHAMVNESVPQEVRQMAVDYTDKIQGVIRRIIEQGQTEGNIRADHPAQLTMLYLAIFQGLATASSFVDRQVVPLPGVETLTRFLRP